MLDPQSSVPDAWDIPSCTPELHCKPPSLKMQRPSLLNCAKTSCNQVQESKAEQGARGHWGVRAGTGTPAHVGAPVQTGLNWAGLLEPLLMFALQLRCLVLAHPTVGEVAQRSSCPWSGTQIWLIPPGEGDEVDSAANGRWEAAARRGQGLWSLVGHGLALAFPTCITVVGCSGGAGAPHTPLVALGLRWGAHGRAEPWGHAMALREAPGTALGSHLETSQHKPAF